MFSIFKVYPMYILYSTCDFCIRCEIIKGGMKEYLTPMGPTLLHVNPIFEIGPVEPRFSEWLVFEGISVDESGRQHFLDASVAYKRAVLNAIDYLSKFGYSKEQVCDLPTPKYFRSCMTMAICIAHAEKEASSDIKHKFI
jgi:hypothetical protein